ncbi:MAG: hypothetical protein L0Y58_24745, partial [Verrucomicrobia subdivision 3 bacterium]|nr:hypothetical protein [Limisphaerales bacterium]
VAALTIPEGRSDADFQVELARMPEGRYRLEFAVGDEWELPSFPDAYARSIQELEIAGSQVRLLDSQARHLEDFLEAVDCGLPIPEFFDPRIAKLLVSRPEVTQRLWEALYRGWRRRDDSAQSPESQPDGPIDLLRYIVTHADEDEVTLLEAFAQALGHVQEQGNLGLAEWGGSAVVYLGAMQRPWGSNLRELFSAQLFSASGGRAVPTLAAVYDQITWTNCSVARQFLSELLSASRIVRHQSLQVCHIQKHHPNAKENELIIVRKAKRQVGVPRGVVMDNTSTAFVPLERWHAVRPAKETPNVICRVLAFFQRALAWGAACCSEDAYNAIDTLGKQTFRIDPRNYVRELLRADSEFRSFAVSPTRGMTDES